MNSDTIGRLARRLETARGNPTPELVDAVAGLSVREQADLALRLPPARRLKWLLAYPRPMRVVRALPDADLYVTVREVGPVDALPLVRLASADQLRHLIDLESWRGDRFDAARSGGWVALILEAGEPSLRRFLADADDELLALLLRKWIRIEQIEYEDGAEKHGHGMGDAGTDRGPMTPDGYHQFSPVVPEHTQAVRRLLQLFYEKQPKRYQRLVWAAAHELPSEVEEQALHWRQSRLEEHGFPPPDEALSVYAPPAGGGPLPRPLPPEDPDGLPASRLPLMPAPAPLAMASLFDEIEDPEALDAALHGAVSLANHLMVADGIDFGDPQGHRAALERAAAYVGIALEARGARTPGEGAGLVTRTPMLELFREGWAHVAGLSRQAREWFEGGWAAGHPRALDLLDSPVQDRIRGLLHPRPRYFALDPDTQSSDFRDFRTLAEVDETRVAVEIARVVGQLLVEKLGFDLTATHATDGAGRALPLRFSTFFLTLLAWHAVRDELRGHPLPADVLADFLRNVASRRTAPPDAPTRALELLVRKLSETCGLAARDVSLLQAFGRACLELLAAECSMLVPGDPVDPRYVSCLILATDAPESRGPR